MKLTSQTVFGDQLALATIIGIFLVECLDLSLNSEWIRNNSITQWISVQSGWNDPQSRLQRIWKWMVIIIYGVNDNDDIRGSIPTNQNNNHNTVILANETQSLIHHKKSDDDSNDDDNDDHTTSMMIDEGRSRSDAIAFDVNGGAGGSPSSLTLSAGMKTPPSKLSLNKLNSKSPLRVRKNTPRKSNMNHTPNQSHSSLKKKTKKQSKNNNNVKNGKNKGFKFDYSNSNDDRIDTKLNMTNLNTYDLFKLFSTIAMFIDHYGYMGLPYANMEQRSWFRVYGRASAPGFFFLCGWSSKKFRLRVWMGSLFLYIFTVLMFLDIVYLPFESILTIAFINCLYKYFPPHRILRNPIVSLSSLIGLHFLKPFFSSTLRIGYGSLPFMFAICGDLIRHHHVNSARIWILGSCVSFGYYSISVFGETTQHSVYIAVGCLINAVFMMFFRIKEITWINQIPPPFLGVIRDGIKWISRKGLIVYIGHLTLYRLIACVWRYERFYLTRN